MNGISGDSKIKTGYYQLCFQVYHIVFFYSQFTVTLYDIYYLTNNLKIFRNHIT